jgi:hypothetical protein
MNVLMTLTFAKMDQHAVIRMDLIDVSVHLQKATMVTCAWVSVLTRLSSTFS